jgi:lysophospholipase L1-like esterase
MRRLALNLALSLASILVALSLLEAGARLYRRGEGGGKERNERRLYVDWDPVLGWKKRPGARVSYRRREYATEVAINSRGLRDPERDPVEPGATRVLALGDSFVEAYSVSLDASVTQVLERRLRGRGCSVDVVNGGTGGYSTDQEYLFYQQQGTRYAPAVVVVFFNVTDVVYNAFPSYFNMPKPAFAVTPGRGLHARNLPLPGWRPRAGREKAAPPPKRPRGSALFALVRQRLLRGAPGTYQALARLGLWPAIEPEAPPAELRVFRRRAPVEVEDGWFITGELLRALRSEVAANGGRLAVAYVPTYFEVDDQAWELTRLQHGLAKDRFDRGLPARRAGALASESGIPFLDLRAALREENGWLRRTYFPRDGHWNEHGHEVAARELEAFLLSGGFLPACGGPATRP